MVPKDQAQAGKGRLRNLVVVVLVLVAAVISVVNIGNLGLNILSENTPTPAPSWEPLQRIQLTASQLYAEYQADAQVADVLYAGKPITVIGDLVSWGKENSLFYITLVTDDAGGDFVRCDFIDYPLMPREWSIESVMSPLLGWKITVKGVCLGLFHDYIIITDCISANMPVYLPD